ncbi:hypothetical protein V9T40_002628 [Parthenolecanium corni]|uniref:Uncharacterized protein n=1 Tax=Parthenolecanium corni TaxID=536013 RepID=A0AAN9Y5J3_9HEMI
MFLTMSVSSADDNSRNILACDESSFSGKFIVEDVIEDDEHYRRLILLNRGNVIQSEVKLKKTTLIHKFFKQYLTRSVKEGVKYDAIIFDVDNKDPTIGISCPPVPFLKMNVLNEVTRCLSDTGIFLLNLVCRSQELRKETFEKLRAVFAGVVSIKTKEDVNEVLICWRKNLHINKKQLEKATENFYKCTKEQSIVLPNDLLPIIDHMENIKL